MNRFAPTRSLASVVMAFSLAALLVLAATMPFTHVRPMTVGFVGMIVTGISMLLRERVFARVTA